jgi:hypothetical protein
MLLVGVLWCLFCVANIGFTVVLALKSQRLRRRRRRFGSEEPRFTVIELAAWLVGLAAGVWLMWRIETGGLLIG